MQLKTLLSRPELAEIIYKAIHSIPSTSGRTGVILWINDQIRQEEWKYKEIQISYADVETLLNSLTPDYHNSIMNDVKKTMRKLFEEKTKEK